MTATYFILARHGRNTYWVERDANETDRATTVRDLVAMQIDKPLQIWAAEDGRWIEISEDIAREIAAAHEPLHPTLIEFVETHCGPLLANELIEDAA